MIRTPAIVVSFAVAVAAFCLPVCAQTTSPPSTCAAPPPPPEPLMITMPKAPEEPACNKGKGCSKAVVTKYNSELNTFNEGIAKANEDFRAYRQKMQAVSAALSDYGNCEYQRINKFMQARIEEVGN